LLLDLAPLREKAANLARFLTCERRLPPAGAPIVADGGNADVAHLRAFLPHRLRTL